MDNNRYEKHPKEDKRYVNWMLKKGHDSRRNTQKKGDAPLSRCASYE